MGKNGTNSQEKEKTPINLIFIIIIIYCLLSIGLPFIFKFVIFESKAYSNLSNNEWAGFLGSYVGGILGGLGTLVSVYYTVKTSIDTQKEEQKRRELEIKQERQIRDKEIKEEHERRDAELKAEKEQQEKQQRIAFSGEIAKLVGEYLTIISNYHFMNDSLEKIYNSLDYSKNELEKIEADISVARKEYETALRNNSDNLSLIHNKILRLKEEQVIAERRYQQYLSEKDAKSSFGNRLKAIECLNILKAKLSNIPESSDLIMKIEDFHNSKSRGQNEKISEWIDRSNNEIIEQYSAFQTTYVNYSNSEQ